MAEADLRVKRIARRDKLGPLARRPALVVVVLDLPERNRAELRDDHPGMIWIANRVPPRERRRTTSV
jgi:hypothetical protein